MLLKLLYGFLGLSLKGALDEFNSLRETKLTMLQDKKQKILGWQPKRLAVREVGNHIQDQILKADNDVAAKEVDREIQHFHMTWLLVWAILFILSVVGIFVLEYCETGNDAKMN